MQECFYNRWTHDHYVTSVFCFYPDGTIPIALFYISALVHDSQVAEFGNIYKKLETIFNTTGGKCCVDLAFEQANWEYLYTSYHDLFASSAPTCEERIEDLARMREATSAQQTVEWGMQTMQASFPWLKDRYCYEEQGEQQLVLKMMVLLFNMRAQMVGIDQIRKHIHEASRAGCKSRCLVLITEDTSPGLGEEPLVGWRGALLFFNH